MTGTPVTFCGQCGGRRIDMGAFCGSCGAPFPALAEPAAPPPVRTPPPAETAAPEPTPAPAPAQVQLGETTFTWPVPDRTVQVNGRPMSLEIVVASAVYGLGALWLLWSIRSAVKILPDLVSGLFSDALTFFFSWLLLLVLMLLVYVIGLLGYTSYSLFRGDPVGRGLSAVITVTLFLTMFSGVSSGTIVFITLLSAACTTTLFLSPWARRALDGGRRHGRPGPVVLSQTLTLTFFLLTGIIGVAFLPGFRYAGTVGAKVIFFVLFMIGASAAALHGYRLLMQGPDKRARLLISGACGAAFVGVLFSDDGSTVLIALGILAGASVPLWLAPTARTWFGDPPLNLRASD
jgi:hypothetical protein